MRVALYALTDFERHASQTTRLTSLVSKLSNAQIVNTALLALAINASLDRDETPGLVADSAGRANLFGGAHRTMGKAWYATVGASLTLTMVSNVVVPQVSFVQKVVATEAKRKLLARFVKTQAALDALYTPTPWQIERSYAIALTTLFVTALYAPGLPVLALLAAVAIGASYGLNKVLVFKFCEQPPNYDEALGRQFATQLYVMAALQLVMAVFVLSEEELLHAPTINWLHDWGDRRGGLSGFALRRMARKNVVPLWLALLAYVAGLSAWCVLGRPLRRCLARICGGGRRHTTNLADLHRQAPFSGVWTSVNTTKALRAKATAAKRLAHDDGDLRLMHDCTLYRTWEDEGHVAPDGTRRKPGDVKLSWEVMAKADLETYNVVRNPKYERVMALLDKLGYQFLDDEEAICRPSATKAASERLQAQAQAAKAPTTDADGRPAPAAPPRPSAQQQAAEAQNILRPKAAWAEVPAEDEAIV